MDCHACGYANRREAKFCGACAEPLGGGMRCLACGTANPLGQRFCDACGIELDAPGPVRPTEGAPTSLGDGRYEVLRFLGEGGRKQVYLAYDNRLEREVAVAVVKTGGLDELGVARARREAEAMGRLGDHPHVVTVFDIGEEDGRLFIVSQFMAGGDLQTLVREAEGHRLAPEDAVRIGQQVAQALEHAHAHGIVHRDIKPQNVWLTDEGVAKLGDFGLAVAADRSRITQEGMMIGTVAYMAPEQALGGQVDARSDLYSLGAVLYVLLCGRPPFVGDDAVAIVSQHVNTPPVAPSWHNPRVPGPLEDLVLRLLAKAPGQRPASATDVRDDLARIAAAAGGGELPAHVPARGGDRPGGGRFVGRERETRDLRAALDDALSGRGRLLMVSGDAGQGKTRLVAELATYAGLRGAQVLWGRCHEGSGAPSYWPWIQVIRAYAHDHDPEALAAELGQGGADVARLVSELRDRLPGLPDPPPLDTEQARFRLFDSISTFLRNAAGSQPLVIVLDDLHAADRLSLLLLEFLALDLRRARILALGTYRDTELDREHPLADTLAALRRERGYGHMPLPGLSAGEVRVLLEDMAGHALEGPDGAGLVDAVYRETEGNPYFAEELVRHLLETGRVCTVDGRWEADLARPGELGVPQGIREVIGRRLERLSGDCGELLAVAAVLGREFRMEVLERVAGVHGDALVECLEEAVGAGVLTEPEGRPGHYAFGHAIVRETLYDDHGTRRRLALHRRAGEVLEELYSPDLGAHVAELAHHELEAATAGDGRRAVEFAVRAGQRATGQLAWEEAADFYERALLLLPPEEADRRCALLLDLGDAQWRAGDASRARETFQHAAEIARQRGLREQLARAALGYGTGLGGFGLTEHADEALIRLLREALEALPPGDDELRARAMARLGVELYYSEHVAERDELCAEAVAMADRIGDPSVRLVTRYSLHWASLGPDGLHHRPAVADELIDLARDVGDREMEFRGRHFRINTLLQLGDIHAVDAEIESCSRLAEELRQPLFAWQATVFRAMRTLLRGEIEEAERLVSQAMQLGRLADEQIATVTAGAQLFFVRWAQGRLAELVDGAREMAVRYPASPWPCALAFLLSEIDQEDEARAAFESVAAGDFGSLRREAEWIGGLALCSLTCGYLRDARRARILYRLLLPYAERYATLIAGALALGHVSLYLGVLAATAGERERAVAHFERALERNERIGATALHVLAKSWYARTLLPSDRERAARMAAEALEPAREFGLASMAGVLVEVRMEAQGLSGAATETSIDAVARSVEQLRPDLSAAAAPDGTVTILFSDIEGSTAMNEQVGDRRWLELMRAHNQTVRRCVRENGGYEVKSRGDGFMLAFASAGRALRCAIDMQRAFVSQPVNVRIGLHTGEAIQADRDFFGTNVNLAARVADSARGGEILVSSLLKQLVDELDEFGFGAGRWLELRGLSGRHEVFAVEWDASAASEPPALRPGASR